MKVKEISHRPIYGLMPDEGKFRLSELELRSNKDGIQWIAETTCSLKKLYSCWLSNISQTIETNDNAFYLSCIILTSAEYTHKRLIRRIVQPNTRNIKSRTVTTSMYLQNAMKSLKEYPNNKDSKMMDEIHIPKPKELQHLLEKTFKGLRNELGYSENIIHDYTYLITTEVKAAANDEDCLKYLKQRGTDRYLSFSEFEKICQTLKEKYPNDAKEVINVLKKTKNRDHLAVLSISIESETIYISMVNEQKKHLRLEGEKFIQLIESPDENWLLHQYKDERLRQYSGMFKFSNNEEGEVLGQFSRKNFCLKIICHKGAMLHDHAFFYLDFSYALCLYLTLQRFKEDKIRFSQLMDTAEPISQYSHLFEKLVVPIE